MNNKLLTFLQIISIWVMVLIVGLIIAIVSHLLVEDINTFLNFFIRTIILLPFVMVALNKTISIIKEHNKS